MVMSIIWHYSHLFLRREVVDAVGETGFYLHVGSQVVVADETLQEEDKDKGRGKGDDIQVRVHW